MLIATCLLQGALQVETINPPDIADSYDYLLNEEKFCKNKRVALFSDKPVYKPGEVVYLTAYFYDVITKAPLSKCSSNKYAHVTVVDAEDKRIKDAQKNFKDQEDFDDYSSFSFKIEVDDKFKGGVYKINLSDSGGDQVKFFVMTYNNRPAGVVDSWNVDDIKPGDNVKGSLTLKTFTKSFEDYSSVKVSYDILNGDGAFLKNVVDQPMSSPDLEVNFLVPETFQKLLVFSFTFNLDGVVVKYKKELIEAIFEEVVVDFNVATGRVARDSINTIYFSAYRSKKKLFGVQINKASVYSIQGNSAVTVINNIESNDEGRGKLELVVTSLDEQLQRKFYLRVEYSPLIVKNYLILDTAEVRFAEVQLQFSKLVYDFDEKAQFTVTDLVGNNQATVVFQDKTKVYGQKLLDFNQIQKISVQKQELISFDISVLGLPNGGVYTIQVFTQEKEELIDEKEKKRIEQEDAESKRKIEERIANGGLRKDYIWRPPYRRPKKIKFLGRIEQEIEIFIKPKSLLSANVSFDKEKYLPGDEVKFTLNIDSLCQFCDKSDSETRAIIAVVDESAFVEMSRSNQSPSLFTKIFLEKEVFHEKNEFRNSFKYIDYLFDLKQRSSSTDRSKNDQRLEYLLGTQSWRKFFLDPSSLQDYLNNSWEDKYKKYRNNFEYLLPQRGGGNFPIMYDAEPMMMRRGGPEMMANAMPEMDMVMNMEMKGAAPPGERMRRKGATKKKEKKEEKEDEEGNSEKSESLEDFLKKDNIFFMKSAEILPEGLTGSFELPQGVTNFNFRIFLYNRKGVYGLVNKTISPRKLFNLFADEPLYILNNEKFYVKFAVENNSDQIKAVNFRKPNNFTLNLDPQSTKTYKLGLTKDVVPLEIEAYDNAGKELGSLKLNPKVIKPGIEVNKGKSGFVSILKTATTELSYVETLPQELIPGNAVLKVCYKNSGVEMIMDAIEKLNRVPTGCFEQASSTSFPIVLALKLILKLKGQPGVDELINSLVENLKKGIKLLLKYETKEGGFEWFGKSPAHSTLTAYGLWQFLEITELDVAEDLFDQALIDRLIKFLEKSKNKKGGFEITKGLDSLGNPPQDVSDIFILFVLSKRIKDLSKLFVPEFENLDSLVRQWRNGSIIMDSYKLAFIGLYLLNKGDSADDVKAVLDTLLSRQNSSTGAIENAELSITRSRGKSLEVETTALTMILFLEAKHNNYDAIEKMLQFLTDNLKDGFFGSTQATILSLMAFEKYLSLFTQNSKEPTQFDVFINDQFSSQLVLGGGDALQKNRCTDLSAQFAPFEKGSNQISIRVTPNASTLSDSNSRFMLSIDLNYFSNLPNSVFSSPLQVMLNKTEGSDISLYSMRITNKEDKEQGMVVYEFYKPSCLDFNLSDLENMRLRGSIDYYELLENNSKIVFYFRGLKSYGFRNFSLSLNKRFDLNDCEERTHQIYLYYDKEGSAIYKRAL